MSTKAVKRASGGEAVKKKKKKTTPKFLLVKDPDPDEPDAPDPVDAGGDDEDWPDREDIRNGLVDQVSSRFGISQDAAIRAINDMLRLS